MDEARAMVTVAMVTYNSASFVGQAIQSVLSQDFADFELLVCDDCSTDDTLGIVKNFHDKRITVVGSQSNLGEYANRNRALGLARGRYLIYLDGDDLLYSHGLGVMVRTMMRFPGVAFLAARPWSERFVYPVELSPREFYLCQFLGEDVAAVNFSQIMFDRQALADCGGFDLRYRSGDTHIQYRLALAHRCLLIADGLAWWRRTPGQASEALLREGWLASEATKYRLELLSSPDCPLDRGEREVAEANVCGVFLRIMLRHLAKGRATRAASLLRASGVRLGHLKHVFVRSRRPFLVEVTAADPISLRMDPAKASQSWAAKGKQERPFRPRDDTSTKKQSGL